MAMLIQILYSVVILSFIHDSTADSVCYKTETVKCGTTPRCDCGATADSYTDVDNVEVLAPNITCDLEIAEPCHEGTCGPDGCDCPACHQGYNCSEWRNDHAPVFSDSNFTIEFDTGDKMDILGIISAIDEDKCEGVTQDQTACCDILYRIGENPKNLFKLENNILHLVKPTEILEHKITFIAYNPVENIEHPTEVPITVLVFSTSVNRIENPSSRVDSDPEDPLFAPKNSGLQGSSDGTHDGLAETKAVVEPTLKQKKTSREPRVIRSFTLSKDGVQFNSHLRVKRSHVGVIPHTFQFTLEAMAPFNEEPVSATVGSVIDYSLTILASSVPTDIRIELLSQRKGSGYFSIQDVKFGHVGANFDNTFVASDHEPKYISTYDDGKVDLVHLNLGEITNVGTLTNVESDSEIVISFRAVMLNHPDLKVGEKYAVSIGVIHGDFITVSEDAIIHEEMPSKPDVDPTFAITGPDSLSVGKTGVWTVTAAVHGVYYQNLALDAFAPLNSTDVLQIDSISVAAWGSNYLYNLDTPWNFTRKEYDGLGDYASLAVRDIINTGYITNAVNSDINSNTITFEVAATMLARENIDYNVENMLGITVYTQDAELEIMWSAQHGVYASPMEITMPMASVMNFRPSMPGVLSGYPISFIVDMTVPTDSSAKYILEVAFPLDDNDVPTMAYKSMTASFIGFNMAHLSNSIDEMTKNVTSMMVLGELTDYLIKWNLGTITNTGQRSGPRDNLVQFVIVGEPIEGAHSAGEEIELAVGMKYADVYYWVGLPKVQVISGPQNITPDTMLTFTFENTMGREAGIYPDTAAVYQLDISVPPSSIHYNITIQFKVDNLTDDTTPLKMVDCKVPHIGAGIYVQGDLTNFSYTGMGHSDSNGEPLYDGADLHIKSIMSLTDEAVDMQHSTLDNVMRVQCAVVARSSASLHHLIDGSTYWTYVTTTFDTNYVHVGRSGVKYHVDNQPSYGTAHWKPYFTAEVSDGYSEAVGVGGVVLYNLRAGIPHKSSSDLRVKASAIGGDAIKVCKLRRRGLGSTLVQSLPEHQGPISTVYSIDLLTDESTLKGYQDYISAVTSYGEGFWTINHPGAEVMYDVIVELVDPNAPPQPIHFSATFGDDIIMRWNNAIVEYKPEDVSNSTAEGASLPLVNVSTYGADTIIIGSAKPVFIDVMIPTGTRYKYDIYIGVPWEAEDYGKFEIVEAFVASVGENLPCFNSDIDISVNSSADNPTGLSNYAMASLSYISNVELAGPTDDDANMIRIATLIRVPEDTSASNNDQLSVGVAVTLNDDQSIGAKIKTFTVTDTYTYDDVLHASQVEIISTRHSQSPDMYVGQVVDYTVEAVIPPDTILPGLRLEITVPIEDGQAYAEFIGVPVISSPEKSYLYGVEPMAWEAFQSDDYNLTAGIRVDYGYLSNAGVRAVPRDVITVNFTLRLLDHIELFDHSLFNISINALIAPPEGALSNIDPNDHIVIPGHGDTTIRAVGSDGDNVLLKWDVKLLSDDVPFDRFSKLSFEFDLALDPADTRRFPDNVTVHFRLPYYSRYEGIVENSMPDLFTPPSDDPDENGMKFTWSTLRFDSEVKVQFEATLDPDGFIPAGLGNKLIKVPVDISYSSIMKSNTSISHEFFTETKTLDLDLVVLECMAPFGMQDGDIKDCQITASSETENHPAIHARFNITDGWESYERGPPFTDFIQVDLQAPVKFTGITLQPFNDIDVSRLVKFELSYSWRGVRWEDVTDANSDVPKLFTATYSENVTPLDYSFVSFGANTFIGQFIRIQPRETAPSTYHSKFRFEIHGCAVPFGAPKPIGNCTVPVAESELESFEPRQWLVNPNDGSMIICMVPHEGFEHVLPKCSASYDSGVSWLVIDDNVINILAFDNTTDAIYALAKNRLSFLRSDNHGRSWFTVEAAEWEQVQTSGAELSWAVSVPFNALTGDQSTEDIYNEFGFSVDSDETCSVSYYGVHVYTTDPAGVALKTRDEEQVARWGDEQWTGLS